MFVEYRVVLLYPMVIVVVESKEISIKLVLLIQDNTYIS